MRGAAPEGFVILSGGGGGGAPPAGGWGGGGGGGVGAWGGGGGGTGNTGGSGPVHSSRIAKLVGVGPPPYASAGGIRLLSVHTVGGGARAIPDTGWATDPVHSGCIARTRRRRASTAAVWLCEEQRRRDSSYRRGGSTGDADGSLTPSIAIAAADFDYSAFDY